jgi:hypothetical protein
MMKSLNNYALRLGIATAVLSLSAPLQAGVLFNFTFTPGTSVQAQAGFITAGNIWSTIFNDDVTIDMTVGTAALAPGILGQAASRQGVVSYSNYKAALGADAASTADAVATSNLQAGSTFKMVMNLTSDNPNGAGSAAPFIDANGSANNTAIRLTTANAKALGFGVSAGAVAGCLASCDAFIQFSTNFGFDYDRADGIGSGLFDFIGVATHEIGHALGFISGVDILDINSPPVGGPFPANAFTYVSPLDLYRFSDLSAANGMFDWTADTRAKYFSLDGGITKGAYFATSRFHGDGQQASHWKDRLNLGIMDPTASPGEILSVSANDRLALDVIGWNLASAPEPSSWAMMVAGLAFISNNLRSRRR